MSETLAIPLDDLKLNGKNFKSKVGHRILQADVSRTTEGASTFTLGLLDPGMVLLDSNIFNARVTVQTGKFSWELAQLRMGGDQLSLTFESLAVAALRKRKNPRKVEPGVMAREQFARALVDEVKWLQFRGPKKPQDRTKIEMARGKVKGSDGDRGEDSWLALGRLAEEVNWTRFEVGNKIFFLPEKELFDDAADYVLRRSNPEVESIDFDWDTGKPVATISAVVNAHRWALPPGTPVQVPNLGPASGKWLVSDISGSMFNKQRTVTLRKPEPALPEPKGEDGDLDLEHSGATPGSSVGGEGRNGWMWPTTGRVSQEFGGDHYGIDIAAVLGTAIVAARDGVVTFAGSASGYGKAVYIDHGGGVICRYGHMSIIRCARGQHVDKGDRIADVGHEGNSTGDHLHFEYRPGDVPRNPREIL